MQSRIAVSLTPADFLELLAREHQWFELLTRLRHRREAYPEGIESDAIAPMLRDRVRWLRN